MAKKNESQKKNSSTGRPEKKQEKSQKVNLSEEKKRDTDDTGPRDKT